MLIGKPPLRNTAKMVLPARRQSDLTWYNLCVSESTRIGSGERSAGKPLGPFSERRASKEVCLLYHLVAFSDRYITISYIDRRMPTLPAFSSIVYDHGSSA